MTQNLEDGLLGPEGEDWRVPVSELAARINRLSKDLAAEGQAVSYTHLTLPTNA